MFILLGHVYSELSCFSNKQDQTKSWVWSSAIGKTKIKLVQLKFLNNFAALSNYLLQRHYWTFLYCSSYSCCSSNFTITIPDAFNLFAYFCSLLVWYMNSFLNYCPYSYHSSNYLYVNISCTVFLFIENLTLLPLSARKRNNYCYWNTIKEQRML